MLDTSTFQEIDMERIVVPSALVNRNCNLATEMVPLLILILDSQSVSFNGYIGILQSPLQVLLLIWQQFPDANALNPST
jgi:hypothetical protein